MHQSQFEMTAECVQQEDGTGSMYVFSSKDVCTQRTSRVRLYSTKSFKPLGTLRYHKSVCQCVEFARDTGNRASSGDEKIEGGDSDEEDEMSWEEKAERNRWLVSGAKDNRVAIWSLISFEK